MGPLETSGKMHCPTCGERLEPGAPTCHACGTVFATRVAQRAPMVRRCPRCGYWGQGVKYFSRTAHLAVLAGLSVFTYGIGGLTYWLVCRNRRVCPRCSFGWENSTRLLAPPSETQPQVTAVAAPTGPMPLSIDQDPPLPGGGLGRRVVGAGVALMAVLVMLIGIVEFEAAAVAVGGVMGAAGSLTFLWGYSALQDRRKALVRGLERKVLLLAQQTGGTLTVSQVAADLNLTLPAAEKILIGMDDGFRVRSDITSEGILVYEFPELQLAAGTRDTQSALETSPPPPRARIRPPRKARSNGEGPGSGRSSASRPAAPGSGSSTPGD